MFFIVSIFLIAFFVCAVIAIVYMLFMIWAASQFKLNAPLPNHDTSEWGVSILIPFRNEALQIEKCLDAFLLQKDLNFPYQIILINDASDDKSEELAAAYLDRLPIQILQSNGSGKKAALQTGLEQALYPIIYTIDADCKVLPHTLASMQKVFVSENLNMLCGFVRLKPALGWFQKLQKAESAALVGVSATMLNARMPATCNGANLMFRKSVFLELKGYDNYKHLSSGDDDFLMHAFFNLKADAVRYAMHPNALVETQAESSISSFFAQRARWASKRKHYLFLYNQYLFMLLGAKFTAFWAFLLIALVSGNQTALVMVGLLYLSEFAFATRLKPVLPVNFFFILLLPLYQFYLPLVLLYSQFFRIQWKGRVIRTK